LQSFPYRCPLVAIVLQGCNATMMAYALQGVNVRS